MRKKPVFSKKAVVTSVFVVGIICLASTMVPVINGKNTTRTLERNFNNNNLTNIENKIQDFIDNQDEITLNDLIFIIKDQISKDNCRSPNFLINLIVQLEQKLPKEELKIPSEVFRNAITCLSKPDSLLLYGIENFISIEKQLQDLQSGKNTEFFLNENKETNPLSNGINYGFDEYWKTYENALSFWLTDSSGVPNYPFVKILDILPIHNNDNYVEWWDGYMNALDFIATLVTGLLFVGTMILILAAPTDDMVNIGLNVIGVLLIITGAYIAGGYIMYTFISNTHFTWLLEDEIDIYIRFIDNTTKEGITNLHLKPNYIEAINQDAIRPEYCDGTPGKEIKDFTYNLKLDEDFKENETGWYSLNARAETIDEKYVKPPCPPGNWTLEIYGSNYETIKPIDVSIHDSESILIGTVPLIPKE